MIELLVRGGRYCIASYLQGIERRKVDQHQCINDTGIIHINVADQILCIILCTTSPTNTKSAMTKKPSLCHIVASISLLTFGYRMASTVFVFGS